MTTMLRAATRSMKGVANPLMTGRAGPGAVGMRRPHGGLHSEDEWGDDCQPSEDRNRCITCR